MDIKELNKTQLILLSLLITFVVSIATGIVTVSLMQQMPKSVPQTINNVIQRTIEKVTTVEVPAVTTKTTNNEQSSAFLGDGDVMVSIYPIGEAVVVPPTDGSNNQTPVENNPPVENTINNTTGNGTTPESPKSLGQGIIISDVGLILVESSILNGYEKFKVILNKTDFEVSILKKFGNGFTVLKIVPKKDISKTDTKTPTTPPITANP